MKIRYVCECCGEILGETPGEVGQSNLTPPADEAIIDRDYAQACTVVKTICEECQAALGWSDDGLTGWLGGVNFFRH